MDEINNNINNSLLNALISELKSQCNKHKNGSCHTLACLERGGYHRGDTPNYETATCERHEQIMALEEKLAQDAIADAIIDKILAEEAARTSK